MLKDFTPQERRVINVITFAVAVRMLGLFLLLPVLSPYLKTLQDATPQLIGLAIGIYGLAQALLQIPFGYLSDKYGRKPIILVGMLTYALGSLMGGLVVNIWSMVLARFIQGFGAVSSAMTALSADLTREEVRTRAFAQIGASIGLTFALSVVIAPMLAGSLGVPFIFFLTTALSLLATYILMSQVPEPTLRSKEREMRPSLSNFSLLLRDQNQLFLNFSIALSHGFLVLVFTLLPYNLVYSYNLPKLHHWKVYLPVVILSLALMVPSIIFAEKRKKLREVFLLALFLLGCSLLVFGVAESLWGVVFAFFLFFLGFNLLEALIPSLLTKITHPDMRGLSLGFFNTTQFFGAFLGGLWGGYALKHGYQTMALWATLLVVLWSILTIFWFRRLRVANRTLDF